MNIERAREILWNTVLAGVAQEKYGDGDGLPTAEELAATFEDFVTSKPPRLPNVSEDEYASFMNFLWDSAKPEHRVPEPATAE
ncbi:hypothetical protein EBR66_05205 [bacterium]|nr:hypothetical protein [bacterium]